jgi:hypothetical protein
VSILLGNGDGTFQPAVAYAAGKSPGCVAVGDFNLDGSLDLVVNSDSNYITVLLGNGDGTFRSPNPYPSLEHPGSLALGDFNGDGKPDLAISNNSFVVILLGDGDGTFQPPTAYNAGYLPIAVTVGDFNGDGKLDLAVGDDGPYLYQRYTGDTISTSWATATAPSGHQSATPRGASLSRSLWEISMAMVRLTWPCSITTSLERMAGMAEISQFC